MKTIALANQKGGSGKSTSASHLACALALRNYRVLLLDTDPQANAAIFFQELKTDSPTLADVITGRDRLSISRAIVETKVPNLNLIQGSRQLSDFEDRKTSTATDLRKALQTLKDALTEVSSQYDFAIIDTPPGLGLLLSTSLAASDFVIIPVQAAPSSLMGLEDLLELIEDVRFMFPKVKILGALCTMLDERTNIAKATLEALKAGFSGKTFDTFIHRQASFDEAFDANEPIQLYAPKSRGANEYNALAAEVLTLLKMSEKRLDKTKAKKR